MTEPTAKIKPLPPLSHAGEPETPLYVLVLTVLLAVTPMIVISQISARWRVDVVDDQLFGYYGWRVLHGAALYRDVWDNKPPGIYWINALGFLVGADSYRGIIALCTIALFTAHLAFFTICYSVYFRGAAVVATVIASFYITHLYFQGGANRTETFLIPCELLAVALYARGFARDRAWKFYLAGAFCGAAFLFKQVGLAAFGAMGVHLLILTLTRDISWRQALRRALLLAGGLITVVTLACAALAAQGILKDALFATFTFNRLYFEANDTRFPYNFKNYWLLKDNALPVLKVPLLLAIAALIHAALWALRPLYRPRDVIEKLSESHPVLPHPMPLFLIWFLVATWGAILSPHAFRHYTVPTLPPLLLMTGYLFNVLQAESSLFRRFQNRIWVLFLFVVMGYLAFDAVGSEYEQFWRTWVQDRKEIVVNGKRQYTPAEWEEVGERLAAVAKPGDRVQCFGYMPGVYLQSRLINATRYGTTEKIGQLPGRTNYIEEEMRRVLESRPPEELVMAASDYFWLAEWKPGFRPRDAFGEWLGIWMKRDYRIVDDVARFNIYILKRADLTPLGTQPSTLPTGANPG